jgi:hypothetical protein
MILLTSNNYIKLKTKTSGSWKERPGEIVSHGRIITEVRSPGRKVTLAMLEFRMQSIREQCAFFSVE